MFNWFKFKEPHLSSGYHIGQGSSKGMRRTNNRKKNFFLKKRSELKGK